MRALVLGYGSIGRRHASVLECLGVQTAVVSGREVEFPRRYRMLAEGMAGFDPDYVVIANETSRHRETLRELERLAYAGTVLVEKPLFGALEDFTGCGVRRAFVGYNLRFHPVLARLKELLQGERILTFQAFVGQYLPDWRPGSDYRRCYSARKEEGGGVLRDLSHELDYLLWLLGGWERVAALGGHLSPLEITSDDAFSLLVATRRCPVAMLQLNYLNRVPRRTVSVNTARCTIEADLIAGTIAVNGETDSFRVERDDSYLGMHRAILFGEKGDPCTVTEGAEVVRLIEAAERAALRKEWIQR